MKDEWGDGAQMGVAFGLGGLVPAAGSEFRRACPWARLPLGRFEKVPEILLSGTFVYISVISCACSSSYFSISNPRISIREARG